MDARSFSVFLSERLKETLQPLENNILNLVSQDTDKNMNYIYRAAGARDVIKLYLDNMEKLVSDFHTSQNPVSTGA